MTELVSEALAAMSGWVGGLGAWSLVFAPLFMALVSVLPVPAEAPAMLNGAVFGPWLGSLVTWIGACLGAWVSFELARRFGRPLAERFVPERTLETSDRMVGQAGWAGLLGLRLLPFVAFTALNWGSGLTPMTRSRFLWTTAVGILPGTVLFTASGASVPVLWRRAPVMVGIALLVLACVWIVRSFRQRRGGAAS